VAAEQKSLRSPVIEHPRRLLIFLQRK